MKPPTFDGIHDPIVGMRWLYDVKGSFFTCSCPAEIAEVQGKGLVEVDDWFVY